MTEAILKKLTAELNRGIDTEVQVVYLLVGIRKLIERDALGRKYPSLKFHCDWALHSRLEGTGARSILREFDAAHALLKGEVQLHDLPATLKNEVLRISKMESFSEELSQFLESHDLPPLTKHRSDGWVHFLSLYTRVIEDIPLVVRQAATDSSPRHITEVTVHCETAREAVTHPGGEEILFKVRWNIVDKHGESGEIFLINTFSLKRTTPSPARR